MWCKFQAREFPEVSKASVMLFFATEVNTKIKIYLNYIPSPWTLSLLDNTLFFLFHQIFACCCLLMSSKSRDTVQGCTSAWNHVTCFCQYIFQSTEHLKAWSKLVLLLVDLSGYKSRQWHPRQIWLFEGADHISLEYNRITHTTAACALTALDVSADLTELGRTPVAVVSAGVKSILDIGRTLEYLVGSMGCWVWKWVM